MSKTKIISYGAIATAVSAVLTLLGGIIPASALIAPIIAGFVLIIIKFAFGIKNAFITFFAVVFLMFVLSPKKSSAFSYLCVFGYYPILFDEFYRIKSVIIRCIIKFTLFESIGVLSLFLILQFVPHIKENENYILLISGGVILYNIFALVYDRFLYLFFMIYRTRIENFVKKI